MNFSNNYNCACNNLVVILTMLGIITNMNNMH